MIIQLSIELTKTESEEFEKITDRLDRQAYLTDKLASQIAPRLKVSLENDKAMALLSVTEQAALTDFVDDVTAEAVATAVAKAVA